MQVNSTIIADQTDAAITSVQSGYFGATVEATAAATVVLIRAGGATGEIIDVFSVPINSTEFHGRTHPVGCPGGIFADVDANTTRAIVYWSP